MALNNENIAIASFIYEVPDSDRAFLAWGAIADAVSELEHLMETSRGIKMVRKELPSLEAEEKRLTALIVKLITMRRAA